MDDREATQLLQAHLQGYRRRSSVDLAALRGQAQVAELRGMTGNAYQVEVEIRWDGAPGGPIRVLGAIDDGGLRSLEPISQDFILSPDGNFVGE